MMKIPAVRERCASIDVGKRGLAVAVMKGPADQEAEIQTRWVGTTVPALKELQSWLVDEGCSSLAMESTGSYWIPVKNVLEDSLHILLVRAEKQPKKDKTDFRDAIDLCHKHRYGLLKGSYLPERGIVELRDLTRRRKKLLGAMSAEKNRIQKVLETANVKIGNVVSDVFGVSGQEIVKALLEENPPGTEALADMAKKRLRNKIPELAETLRDHQMNGHHRWLIQQSVDHIVLLDGQLEQLEERIAEKLGRYRQQIELLVTIPGIQETGAAAILAEIGPDMKVFETPAHLASWAGICPGNRRSAGKSKSSHIKKANKFLLAALIEASWGAVRTKDSGFQRAFYRWRGKLGPKKANIAGAHRLLRVIHAVLSRNQPYAEPDPAAMHELERRKRIHHHINKLRALGAEDLMIHQLEEKLLQASPPVVETRPWQKKAHSLDPERRGALGFRARYIRNPYTRAMQKDGPNLQRTQRSP